MAKTKTPFLSLGARGSVGESITAQKRYHASVLRGKPLPTDPRSLPQVYQRWLYQDYAYLWTVQNAATRRDYASLGSRFHLTGYQMWMKAQLSTLPDICAYYKMDTGSLIVAADSSKNNLPITIFGPVPAEGIIDGALSWDGLNDYCYRIDAPPLNPTSELTIELLLIPAIPAIAWRRIISKGLETGIGLQYDIGYDNTGHYRGAIQTTGGGCYPVSTSPVVAEPTHVALTYDGSDGRLYVNGLLETTVHIIGTILTTNQGLWLGTYKITGPWWKGVIDQAIIYNRCLDDSEILRHAARSYSL